MLLPFFEISNFNVQIILVLSQSKTFIILDVPNKSCMQALNLARMSLLSVMMLSHAIFIFLACSF